VNIVGLLDERVSGVAVFALARKLAILIFRMIRWGSEYVDEGCRAYEERFKAARLQFCKETSKDFGYKMLPEMKLQDKESQTRDHPSN